MQKYYNIKLGIIDDYFPNIKTGFRVSEFNWYMSHLDDVQIYVGKANYIKFLDEYISFYPENLDKIKCYKDLNITEFVNQLRSCDVLYTVFAINAFRYLEYFNLAQKPFVFTIYPGGGFVLNNPTVDMRLREIFQSKYFYKVIVTQKIIYDYLIDNKFLPKEKIEFIYGGITYKPSYKVTKKLYNKGKYTFDICFVANKYHQDIKGKGYDIFIEVCHKITQRDNEIRFHVVGGYGKDDIDISKLGDKIKFYGLQNQDFFQMFYPKIDIIISPTRPFILAKGGFDGLPTTCCVDAALNGVVVFTTDQLNLNTWIENDEEKNIFKDGENICIINENVDEIVEKILFYKKNLEMFYNLSAKAKDRFTEIFSIDAQMNKRMEVLKSVLKNK